MISYAFLIGDTIENKPINYAQACKSKNKSDWLKIMESEINSLHKNHV